MAVPYLRPYLDSGVFISWLRPDDLGPLADGTIGDRHPISRQVLADAEKGIYEITTSFFTMAEVYKKVGHGTTWNIGQDANRLLVEHRNDKLRPVDAIHLASALRAKCDVALFSRARS